MSTSTPLALVALSFDSPLKAQEALLAMTRLQEQGVVLLRDAVFIHRDTDGSVRVVETTDITPGDAALEGTFWGALVGTLLVPGIGTIVGGAVSAGLGALAAKLTDIGIPDATVKELETQAQPGTSIVALLVSHLNEEAFLTEMHRFAGAGLVQSTLSADAVARLRTALEPS